VRFLKAAQDTHNADQVSILQSEVDFLHRSITKAGQRIPVAYRFARMVRDLMASHCGLKPTLAGDLSYSGSAPDIFASSGADLLLLQSATIKNAEPQDSIYDTSAFLSILQ